MVGFLTSGSCAETTANLLGYFPRSGSRVYVTALARWHETRLALRVRSDVAMTVWLGLPREYSPELVDDANGETEPDRIGLTQEGDLLHVTLDVPFGVRAATEEDHVTDTITLRRHALAFDHDRPLEDDDGFVEIVVPVELALSAGPDQRRGGPVRARR